MTRQPLTGLIGGLALFGLMTAAVGAQEPPPHLYSSQDILQDATAPQQDLVLEQAVPESTEGKIVTVAGSGSEEGCKVADTYQPGHLMQSLQGHEVGKTLDCYGIRIGGWLEQGFTWNPDSPDNRFNVPVRMNDRSNEYQMNQLYVYMERPVNTESCCWDIGGRVDVLYGTDYFFTEALGLELEQDGSEKWNSEDGPRLSRDFTSGARLYGIALPQIYAEVYAPIHGGVSVKAGHFYSILGYESVPAVENFFYSHSYAFGVAGFVRPFTHTGILASYKLNDRLAVQSGYTLGSDSFSNPNDNLGYLYSIQWTSCNDRTTLAWAFHVSDEDPVFRPLDIPDFGGDGNNRDDTRYVQTIVLTHKICDNLTYVIESILGFEDDSAVNNALTRDDAEWYGINQYLFYKINDCLSTGMRFEWFRDDDFSQVFISALPPDGGNYYELTLGLNWKPYENMLVRPEARWDWSNTDLRSAGIPGVIGIFDDLSDKNQFTLGVDVIVTF